MCCDTARDLGKNSDWRIEWAVALRDNVVFSGVVGRYRRTASMMADAMAVTRIPTDWARHPDKQPPESIFPVPS
ncbi:MAG TPA: hypothetical protein VN415_01990 [Dehalococcoidia bacterium]|nr:hypothetical protein [Dehalococcoidia bacterium]